MRIFKNIIIALLLVLVLIESFTTVAIIAHFEANRRFYAEVLCINKNRPELACKGKCVLKQRLKHELEKNNDAERQTLEYIFANELTL